MTTSQRFTSIPDDFVVCITRNSEYFLVNLVCVGVRQRGNGQWDFAHPVLGRRTLGMIEHAANGEVRHHHRLTTNARLIFRTDGPTLATSTVLSITRPLADHSAHWRRSSPVVHRAQQS